MSDLPEFDALQIHWRDAFQQTAEQIVDIVRKNPELIAAGPPVELAEDEFIAFGGDRCRMRVDYVGVGKAPALFVLLPNDPPWFVRSELAALASNLPEENGWPRALAYFDRHVAKPKCQKCNGTGRSCGDRHCPYQWCTPCVDCGPLAKPEPARVTDVRFVKPHHADPYVLFLFSGEPYSYDGHWGERDPLKDALHPLDIALIERCWAEGRLGEREVLTDQGIVGVVSDRRITLKRGQVPWLCMSDLAGNDDESWDWGAEDGSYQITIHDPAQRARVRAIVAALHADKCPTCGRAK